MPTPDRPAGVVMDGLFTAIRSAVDVLNDPAATRGQREKTAAALARTAAVAELNSGLLRARRDSED